MHSRQITKSDQVNLQKNSQYKLRLAKRTQPQLNSVLQLHQTVGNQAVSRMVQAKLKIGQPGDKYEREADRIAEQVMRMPDGHVDGILKSPTKIQRKCATCEKGKALCPNCTEEAERIQLKPLNSHIMPFVQRQLEPEDASKEEEEEFIQAKGKPGNTPAITPNIDANITALHGGGQPLPDATRSFFESRFGVDFSEVRVHTSSQANATAGELKAKAFTVGQDVIFGTGEYSPETSNGKKLLTHELVHVLQQNRNESQGVIRRTPDPFKERNEALVRRAKERLMILGPLLTQLRIQSTRTTQERLDILKEREALDATIVEPAPPGHRQRAEEAQIRQLNSQPLQIQVSDSAVIFRVSFQIKFEDTAMGDQRYQELVRKMRAGIELVWNQRLSGRALGGRRFELQPRFTRVPGNAVRDLDHWLIFVRAQDLGKVNYPGCSLDSTDPNIPTSVTDPTCEGGVMIVPPRHISRPSVLGHETLHLFGLVDRYVSFTYYKPGQAPVVRNEATRETGGRSDPLGTEQGTILREDLGFLFARLGVYDQELSRLRSNIATIELEAHRLREIVRLGRDPNSLIDSVIRRDFRDRLLESIEDL